MTRPLLGMAATLVERLRFRRMERQIHLIYYTHVAPRGVQLHAKSHNILLGLYPISSSPQSRAFGPLYPWLGFLVFCLNRQTTLLEIQNYWTSCRRLLID